MHLSKKSYIIIGIVVLLILAVFILKLVSADSSRRGTPRPLVVVGQMKNGDVMKIESLTGDILPTQQASIFSKVSGNLEKIYFDIGQRVKPNQTIALIDTTIYNQNAKQAKANFMQASANYENSKLNFERNKKLLEQNLVSQQDLDNAKATYNVNLAQKEAAEAAYNNAVTQLSYCRITAITKRLLDPGANITASTGTASSILFMLMDTDHLKIMVNIPERSVPYLKNVKEVIIRADAIPNQTFKGNISKISGSIDLNTRTMAVEVAVDNSAQLLKPGMFATVQLLIEKKTNVPTLLNQVVLNDEKGDYVFVLNPDTTVTRKYIHVGIRMDTLFEIISGLNTGDKVVVIGQTLVKDNSKVKIVK